MEWNEEVEKKLKRRGEIWHAEKLASRLIFDGRRALEHYTALMDYDTLEDAERAMDELATAINKTN